MQADRRMAEGFSRLSCIAAFQGESINHIEQWLSPLLSRIFTYQNHRCHHLHHSTSASATTMPAFKTKTNLPTARKDSSSLVDVPEKKKKPYVRKTVDIDKETTKKPKTKAQPKKTKAALAMDLPCEISGSTRQVEVVIDRMTVEEDIAGIVDEEEQSGNVQTAGNPDGRFSSDIAGNMQGVNQTRAGRKAEPEFWKGEEQESMDDLINNLLGKDKALNGGAGKGARSDMDFKHQGQGGNGAALDRAVGSGNKQSSNDTSAPVHQTHAKSSESKPLDAVPSNRSQPDLSKGDEEDLIHFVVIKVIEHALSRNVDWYKMAAEGFAGKKAVQPAKAKGKGKGKKADPSGDEEGTGSRKLLGKVDGNYLCESLWFALRWFRRLILSLACIDDLFHYVSPRMSKLHSTDVSQHYRLTLGGSPC